ncbi:flagellar hook-basal body protein [Thiohalorhabdus sp.]|uniref:flagellar hook-basal body protein n=1 Tax=Thiohalorhabdus sp. TaxID=3094134 RepID=UPI002FC2FD95
MDPLSASASAMQAFQQKQAVTANNVANANTQGFSPSRAELAAQPQAAQQGTGASAVTAAGNGVAVGAVNRLGAGEVAGLQTTGRSLDVAINGNGLLPVETGDGQAFTRAGSLQTNGDGQVTDANGNPVAGDIKLPVGASNAAVGRDGTVTYESANGQRQEAGQIEVAAFANPAGLEARGDGLFQATQASGAPNRGEPGTGGRGALESGALEASGTSLVNSMVDLIQAQRAFEANTGAFQTADQMRQSALDITT